VAVLAIGLNA